eukprot:CAMPEP_0172084262 /NCGR_PEP_ID=MMETSP1043-20130122/20896_1 /TAXON_ID=464988 /ORGANISM="Hemiselmis andersenii, Strain CCMP441" /LENGTH=471 /DNA_ID=CAMNT_0012746067 /DNA_START=114 /DNA_END=1530 /DNA_ORIENTATION=+
MPDRFLCLQGPWQQQDFVRHHAGARADRVREGAVSVFFLHGILRGWTRQKETGVLGEGGVEGYGDDTKFVKGGHKGSQWTTDPLGRSVVNPPTIHASTVTFPTVGALREATKDYPFRGLSYGRHGTPTSWALEEAFATLEGGDKACAVSSGVAAINSAMLAFLESGDHCLVSDGVYDPTRSFCDHFLARFGVETTYFDPVCSPKELEAMIKPNTKLLFLESPSSLSFELHDFSGLAKVGKLHDLAVVCDNTWGPSIFKPLKLGADVSLNAATKYIGGHSDLMLGLIACTKETYRRVKLSVKALGCPAGPDDCYLALRGIRTLGVRLQRHEESGLAIARWLEQRPEVTRVMHPALPSHPQHQVWKREFTGSCGLFSFQLTDEFGNEAADAFCDSLIQGLFAMGYSWGGFESLVLPVEINSARSATQWDYVSPGCGPTVRLHIGLEDVEDLKVDLEGGFAAMRARQLEVENKG